MSTRRLHGFWIACALVAIVTLISTAHAANRNVVRRAENSDGDSSSSYRQAMMVDLAVHYVRDTKPEGSTDTAARMSLGGMFTDWLGLDAVGQYQVKSKDYLVGGDLRISPTEWFFVKAGMGAYADKVTREFQTTPLLGGGILARFRGGYYLVSEFSYFQVTQRDNVSFGAGLGMAF